MALPSPAHTGEKDSPLESQPIAFPGGFKDTRGTRRKRSKRRDACYDKRSDSWVGNGCHPDGSRWRRQGFPDFEAARSWALQTKGQMDELAYRAADLPAAVRRDVAFALGLRAGAGLVPYEEGFFARLIREDMARTPCGKKVTFREVVNEWLAGKEAGVMNDEIKARTVKDAKDCIAPALAEFGDKFVSDILKRDIEKVLNEFTSYRRRNIHMRINEVFRYCQQNRILGTAPENNPCYGIKWPKIKERLPEPILVDDAKKLFALAVQTEDRLGCTAWVAFRMFEALRDAEASKTTYASVKGINVPRGFIHLPWEVAKKRERMVFFDSTKCPDPKLREFIPANLKVILSELPLRTDGQLAPSRREIDIFKRYARHCGIIWEANGLRAGFASHHFALYQDAGVASKLMGHLASDGGVEVFYDHYYKFADYEAGKAYFEIGLNGLKAAAAAFAPPMTLDEFRALSTANPSRPHPCSTLKNPLRQERSKSLLCLSDSRKEGPVRDGHQPSMR
jgi:hypothetical protein